MSNHLEDLEKYAATWDKALADGFAGEKPVKKEEPKRSANFFGQIGAEEEEEVALTESDISAWSRLYNASKNQSAFFENEDVEGKADAAKKMANAYHPIEPSSVGKDSTNAGVAMDEVKFAALEDLKLKLEKLEIDLNKKDALKKNAIQKEDTSADTLLAQIQKIKDKIDEISDAITGSKIGNEKN